LEGNLISIVVRVKYLYSERKVFDEMPERAIFLYDSVCLCWACTI